MTDVFSVFFLESLAVAGLTRTIITASILDVPRNKVAALHPLVAQLLSCFYCLSFWVSVIAVVSTWSRWVGVFCNSGFVNSIFVLLALHNFSAFSFVIYDYYANEFAAADRIFGLEHS